jgi:allophanate hydrolase subunit 2
VISVDVAPGLEPEENPVLRIAAGPRDDWFETLAPLARGAYEVTAQSNRVGVRLDGPALARRRQGELASEGMVTGALQVPPNGLPIIFLADHPTTGGYPVAAVLATADIGRAAQLRPGQRVRFRIIGRA